MRRVIAQEFVSIDGVMESPEKWQLANELFDEAMGEPISAAFMAAEALLLGRRTYQEFAAFWPNQSDDDPFAKQMNGMPKYVVSKTLAAPLQWKATVVGGDVTSAVSKLKQQSGRDLLIIGSAQLVSGLTASGLIDEYQLFVHPIVVGRGKHLFADGIDPTLLELTRSRTFHTGVLELNYRRRGKAKLG